MSEKKIVYKPRYLIATYSDLGDRSLFNTIDAALATANDQLHDGDIDLGDGDDCIMILKVEKIISVVPRTETTIQDGSNIERVFIQINKVLSS